MLQHSHYLNSNGQGFDGFLSGKENRRSRQAKVVMPDEFLFSLSSMTSEVWNKMQPSQDMQDVEYAPMGSGKRARALPILFSTPTKQ